MKRIAIFCDGTWNTSNIPETTHVHELYTAAANTEDQLPWYLPGVGTNEDMPKGIRRFVRKYTGGALGWGLNAKVREAYRFLAEHYEPGDEILIFGFSRGAFTARSLAGMIRKAGFPDRVTLSTVHRAFWLYRQPGEHNAPDAPHIMAYRRTMSPRFATSEADLASRTAEASLIKITYLGIWDTVGALGIPTKLAGGLSKIINFRHQFHDLELSSTILSARHALALDEQRAFYPPSPWTNLNRLSRGKGFGQTAASEIERPYQQMWFVGDHGMVGGSGTLQPLTAVTMDWIAEGARQVGMTFKDDVPLPQVTPDPTVAGSIYSNTDFNPDAPGPLTERRKGPEHGFEVAPSVEARARAHPDYRPPNLRRARPDLF